MNAPYIPDDLPLPNLDYGRLIGPVGQARDALATYNALLSRLENPALMLSPLMTQEAVLSSRIEGTQATLEDVLDFDAGQVFTGEPGNDIQEITNYRTAMTQAFAHLQEMPISLWMIRQMHQTLLNSARGQNKSPGKFRDQQNWIGPPGSYKFEDATYVPPDPTQLMGHLENWETYLAFEDREPLVQSAIIHAQFEIIHPFLDGNGRMGRLLIPLYLYQRQLLAYPAFYMSAYLGRNRSQYYERLRAITAAGQWSEWCEFFLMGVAQQAWRNQITLHKVEDLRAKTVEVVSSLTHSLSAPKLVQALFAQPVFVARDFVVRTNLNKRTAANHLHQLKEAGILTVDRKAAGTKPKRLAFTKLIKIVVGSDDEPPIAHQVHA